MDKAAVVILNYNGVEHLKRFLPTVVKYSSPFRVVVIDNYSQDQSVAYIKDHFPRVQLIELESNYGFSGGYNRGLPQVKAENFILLNSDVEVTEGWIDPLVRYMDLHPQTAVCQPKILSLADRSRFDYAGAAGGFVDFLGYPFCRGRLFDHLETDHGQYDGSCSIFWAGGACFFVRRSVFNELEGFDEDFFAHMEEIDLCWRCQLAGYQVAFVEGSKVYHLGGGTLKETNPYKTYLNFRNSLQMLLKNSTLTQLVWKIPLRMMLDLVAAARFLVLGSWSHFLAVIRAEAGFVKRLPGTWQKRPHDLSRELSLFPKMVALEYFVKGKKTYDRL